MRTELQPALQAAKSLPAEELPELLGQLEQIRVTAMVRLSSPPFPAPLTGLCDVSECALLLGVSEDYVYHHHKEFPFTRHIGSRLLFDRAGIPKWLDRRRTA